MPVKINTLEVENVKRIRAVQLTPAANGLTLIGGNNNQGKTSVLDSICWLLGGKKFEPTNAKREGALIELCIAIAEGRKWLSWQCTKGRVLYVNLELDRASCLHRFHDGYTALHIPPQNLSCIDIWNLRGVTEPMDKLAPKLIRRAKKQNYIAIIIDPIYKVITGDENSADQMAHFCNQFDKVCTALGCAVIYCHHHSKGTQGGKRSMDRASGSGVFARDPDALLDMIELDLTEEIVKQMQNQAACRVCETHLSRNAPDALATATQDDLLNRNAAVQICRDHFTNEQYAALQRELTAQDVYCAQMTAWRLEGTLREFPKFAPKNLWFKYPIHEVDSIGVLQDLQTDVNLTSYQRGAKRGGETQKRAAKAKAADKNAELLNIFDAVKFTEDVTVQNFAEYLGVDEKTIRRRIKSCGELTVNNNIVTRKAK